MRLQIAARHMQLTQALADYTRRRFLGTLPRHYDRDSCDLRVEIDHVVGGNKRRFEEVRAQLSVPGALLVVHSRARDAYAAIDQAQRTLVRRLEEWRKRMFDGARHPKKYYAARLAEEGLLPSLSPVMTGAAVYADEAGPEASGGQVTQGPSESRTWREPTALLELLRTRRSMRRFTTEPIPDPLLAALHEALIEAPSAGNLESRRFYFVQTRAVREALAAATGDQRFVAQAPLLVVCCANLASASIYHQRGVEIYAPMDVAASIENLLLTAHAAGLGSAWVGEFDEAEVARVLSLPSEIRPLALVVVGFSDEHPLPPTHLPDHTLIQRI